MAEAPSIRQAIYEDVPIILSFIRAGAEETGALDHVKTTESALLSNLKFADLSRDSDAFATPIILTAPDGAKAGFAIYYPTFSTWLGKRNLCLEELYVKPEYRRKGYAKLLIQHLAKEVQRMGGGRVDWVCLKDNERALKFYESLGAKTKEYLMTLNVEGEALETLADHDL